MQYIERKVSKLIKNVIIKLLFYSIVIFLVILPIHKTTSSTLPKKTLKYQGKLHIREPTFNPYLLILEEKKRFVVNLHKKNTVHHKEQNKTKYRTIHAIITAYTSGIESTGKTSSDPAYKITASGKKVKEGVTLACPKQYSFGTIVMIKGIGERICSDRGGSIYGEHFDLYVNDYDTAIKFGVQHRTVKIIGG